MKSDYSGIRLPNGFIKVTNLNRKTVFINATKIAYCMPSHKDEKSKTCIVFDSCDTEGGYWKVLEPLPLVMNMVRMAIGNST